MSSLQFSANLNFLFAEGGAGMLERYRRASRAGFRAVENGFPADVSVGEAADVQRETGLQVVLLNICLGSAKGGEVGCAAIPGMEAEFERNLQLTIEFAQALGCKKIHLMAGKLAAGCAVTDEHHQTYERNLRYAVGQLEPLGIVGLIEPICEYGVPGYYLHSYDRAVALIERLNSGSLRLMLDLYHLQHIAGNVTYRVRELMKHVGHVQIAQVPLRGEPHTLGELNYAYVFQVLEESGYRSWIGLEYRPQLETVLGLGQWLAKYGYAL